MAWSNIFLQLVTLTGPVIGEGLLEGWQTSIELEKFSWDAHVRDKAEMEAANVKGGGGLGAAAAGALGKAGSLVGGLLGLGGIQVEMGELKFTKRFDISSAMIHTCIDNNIPILSASITVLNIKHGGRAIHEPGFTLVATDGYFRESELEMSAQGHAVEVKENLTLQFNSIVISYLKKVGKDNIPTNPFFYKAT